MPLFQLNDCKREALRFLTGLELATQDMELIWLQNNGATSTTLQEAWIDYLLLQGAAPASLQDMQMAWLDGLGFGGAIQDRLIEFWCDQVPEALDLITHNGNPITHRGVAVTHEDP